MTNTKTMTTSGNNPVAEILEALMAKHQLNQTGLAQRSGVSQPAINRILKERTKAKHPRKETLQKISAVLGVTPGQLTGEEPIAIRTFAKGMVPFVQWENLTGLPVSGEPGQHSSLMICPVEHGDLTFALPVVGEAMTGEDGYREGDIIFIDPGAHHGHGKDVVVVKGQSAFFRRMVITPEGQFLKALNPSWPTPIIPLTNDAVVCGTIVFSGRVR